MYLLPDGRDELTERETPLCFLIYSFGIVSVCRRHALRALGDVYIEQRIVDRGQLDGEIDDQKVQA